MASFTKRGDSWFAQVRRKGHKTISKSFPKKTLAEQWARTIEAEIDAKKYQDSRSIANVPFSTIIKRYEEEFEEIKPFGKNKKSVIKNIKRDLGKVMMADLTDSRILEYVDTRISSGAGGVTVSIDLTYIGQILKAAKHLWGLPVSIEHLDTVRSKLKIRGVKTRSNERDRRPTLEEIELLYKHYQEKKKFKRSVPMEDIIRFAIETAMREGEITRIRWDDLNEKDKTIIIRDRKDPREKIGNDQTVPLLGDAFDIAMRQPKKSTRIFPYSADTIATIFPRACSSIGIEDLHFHDLRHEGISRLFEKGYQIHEVALVSGHKDWKQLKRYTQLKAKDLHR